MLLTLGTAGLPVRAAEGGEGDWLATLHSAADRPAKEEACRQLKRTGSAAAVPALAGLLGDAALGQAARDALASLPCPEALQALLAALDTLSGPARCGVVDSLGARRETAAVPRLTPLLASPDPDLAAAVALALGRIGGAPAVAALGEGLRTAPTSRRETLAEGLLRAADRALADGDSATATSLYERVFAAAASQSTRAAGYVGRLRTAAKPAEPLTQAVRGDDAYLRDAVLVATADLPAPEVTQALAAEVPTAAPALQVTLLGLLARRGDTQAAAVAAERLASPHADVRAAALAALGALGEAGHVDALLKAAAAGLETEREAAREALRRVRRGDVRGRLLAALRDSPPAVQEEALNALARRNDREAGAALIEIAGGAEPGVAAAALTALARLADAPAVPAMARILVRASQPAVREAAARALIGVGQRTTPRDPVATAVLGAMAEADSAAKGLLLRVAAEVGGAGVTEALRQGAASTDEAVREAAIRALADCAGADALPDLLRLGREAPTPVLRVLALRGYWRVVGTVADRPVEERLTLCRDGLAAGDRAEEKRLALAQIGRLPHRAALDLAVAAAAEEAVRTEAQLAAVQVCRLIAASDREAAGDCLRKLAAEGSGDTVRAEAAAAVDALDRLASYIMPWLAAGPYRQAGKECQQLFDVVAGPEVPGAQVEWRPAPVPADPALAWQVDLGPIVNGNQALAYIRTRVFSPKEQTLTVAIGVDDGVKLWVNGQLVHANNAVRGLTPDQDKAQVTLRQGWNELLAKVTQNVMGCGLCLRLTTPDGLPIAGLRVDPNGQ